MPKKDKEGNEANKKDIKIDPKKGDPKQDDTKKKGKKVKKKLMMERSNSD
eukprot:CAMPEP_0194227830 /NCGR_PEP_ID=MMETSP0156-20130528/43060_1 /TAXON_ID=33649 /ORGANISM="Thalassionema nitzschioides, Strain L26-B" /LENGTH=49 /DNA_ID=CAMNT_0038960325 /DNA_START=2431 /DNA_END=2580 /DNA_ORIENTATION=+